MLELLFVVIRASMLAWRGHQAVLLENIALRYQLRTLKRTVKRPQLRTRDRLFWILLANTMDYPQLSAAKPAPVRPILSTIEFGRSSVR